jgi:hypothetical protein
MPANGRPTTLLTPRDVEILRALDMAPLTAAQLVKLSTTFAAPFPSERRARDRLQTLCAAGRVRRWFYATAGRGALGYYTLSRLGHQLLHAGEDVPAAKRAFGPVGLARQFHTLALADFLVHTAVASHAQGIRLDGFYRENACCLTIGGDSLYPDAAFQLVTPQGREFSFFVELDNSTERLRSPIGIDSWDRKLRLYDALAHSVPGRFRLIVVATRSTARVRHVLELAKSVLRNPRRGLVCAITLAEYMANPHAVTSRCFHDHAGRRVPLVWTAQRADVTASCYDAVPATAAAATV